MRGRGQPFHRLFAHMSGNRPRDTKPEEWSPKGWGRASSAGLKTQGKARSSSRCQSQGLLQTGKGRASFRPISYSSWRGPGSILSDAGHKQYSELRRYSTIYLLTDFFLLSKNNLREFKIHSSNKSLKENQVYRRTPSEKACSEEQFPIDPKDTTPTRGCEWHKRDALAQTGWTEVQLLHLKHTQLSRPLP